MKVIKVDGDIISLENITRVEKITTGTGCKSNPYHYYITVNFHGGEREMAEFETEKEQSEVMEKIYDILTEKA